MIRLSALITEKQCPRCHGTKHVRAKEDKAYVQCPECRGTGKAINEMGSDTAGADNMGSYRAIAVDDPFAGRIQLANLLRRFADMVESVSKGPQFDPRHDTYDSAGIDGFVETIGETQKMMSKVVNFWKQRMANIDKAQEKEL